jgi:hypothetical protein
VAAQHRVLVPEHQQLSILRPVAPEHQDSQAEHAAGQQVDDLEQHPDRQPSPRPPAGNSAGQPCNRVFERHRMPARAHRTLVWNQAHLRRILTDYEAHHNQHRPHRSLNGAAPLKPLPEPVNLAQYRVRKHARVDGLINEYRLVA